jgi:hypothetical protein
MYADLSWESLFSSNSEIPLDLDVSNFEFVLPGPKPVRFDPDQTPVYDSNQIEVFGLPETWGVFCYRVIALRETEHPMVTDWVMEQERGKLRPIHRYSRVERFTSILAQLICSRGKIPKEMIQKIREHEIPKDPDLAWNAVRKILKDMKARKYYNRIPIILQMLGYPQHAGCKENGIMRDIINDFRILSSRFDQVKQNLNRVYFPSLRFIAFKLLQLHGVEFKYKIPFVRTPRKLKAMEQIWDLLI